jgi:FKBP-type peptidyl-prolyl cis-trans isomerase SlyD
MKIESGALVSLEVALSDAQGNPLEQSEEPLVYLHGHDDIFPRVEEALEGKEAGAQVALQLEPEDAFGDYDADLVMLMPLEDLGQDVQVGMRIEGDATAGTAGRIFTITDIADGMAVLDGNHPLAGIAVRLAITVIDVRAATPEELSEAETPRLPDFLRLAEPRTRRLH